MVPVVEQTDVVGDGLISIVPDGVTMPTRGLLYAKSYPYP